MHPDQVSNWQPFGARDDAQLTALTESLWLGYNLGF